jgi:hypothetical protein
MKSFDSTFQASRAPRCNVVARCDASSIGSGRQNRNGRCSGHGRSFCLANRGGIAEGSGRLQKSVTADYPARGPSHPDRSLESGAVLATPEKSCLVAAVARESHTPSPGAIPKHDFGEEGGPRQKDPEQHGGNGWIQDEGIFAGLVFRLARNRCGSENQPAGGTGPHGVNVVAPEVEFAGRRVRLRSSERIATTENGGSDIGQLPLQTLLAELGSRRVRTVKLRGRP